MKNAKIIMASAIILFSFLSFSSPVDAAKEKDTADAAKASAATTVKINDPLGGATPQQLIGRVIKGLLGIIGSLALAIFIYGGFTWMTAMGDAAAVTKGKNTLTWAAIGLIVIFTSYALVNFVFNTIGV